MAIVVKNPRFSGLDQDPASASYGTHVSAALTGFALYSPSIATGDELVPDVIPQIPAVLYADVAAGGVDVDIVLPYACSVQIAVGYKVGAGGAGSQVELFNGADLIGTIDCNVADKAFLSLADRDPAHIVFAAGDTLTLTPTDGAADAACALQVTILKR
jgi:hypothetical protein